jgi:hypothetical protein
VGPTAGSVALRQDVLRLVTYHRCDAQLEFFNSFEWARLLHVLCDESVMKLPMNLGFTLAARTGVEPVYQP